LWLPHFDLSRAGIIRFPRATLEVRETTVPTTTENHSADDAQTAAFAELDKETTTAVILEKQNDGTWKVTTQP
jgi:hypothetical protein